MTNLSSSCGATLILISTASILVDHHSLLFVRDRISFQILLWLSISLQQKYDDSILFFLANAIIFSNITSAVLVSKLLLFVAPSIWIVMMFHIIITRVMITTTSTTFTTATYLVLFMTCFISLSIWKWWWQNRLDPRTRKEQRGMPIITQQQRDNNNMIDESKWYTWSVQDVAWWYSSSDDDDAEVFARILTSQRIDGKAFTSLTLENLCTLVGLPFGAAHRLMQQIRTLQHCYPPPAEIIIQQNEDAAQKRPFGGSSWLDQHDQQYNNNYKYYDTQQPSYEDHNNAVMDDETTERVRSMFKEQFGLELPELRRPSQQQQASSTQQQQQQQDPLQQQQQHHSSSSPTEATTATAESAPPLGTLEDLPPEFLESMPAHIRTIANRKPDLVRQLLEARRRQQTSPWEERSTHSQESQEYEANEDGDERTELLRKRRTSHNQQYKSL